MFLEKFPILFFPEELNEVLTSLKLRFLETFGNPLIEKYWKSSFWKHGQS